MTITDTSPDRAAPAVEAAAAVAAAAAAVVAGMTETGAAEGVEREEVAPLAMAARRALAWARAIQSGASAAGGRERRVAAGVGVETAATWSAGGCCRCCRCCCRCYCYSAA